MHKQKEFRLFNILNIVSHCTKHCGALYQTLRSIVLNIRYNCTQYWGQILWTCISTVYFLVLNPMRCFYHAVLGISPKAKRRWTNRSPLLKQTWGRVSRPHVTSIIQHTTQGWQLTVDSLFLALDVGVFHFRTSPQLIDGCTINQCLQFSA